MTRDPWTDAVERIPDEAAVARLGLEQPDLPLELNRCSGNQRHPKRDTRVANGEPGRKIVASVDDEIVAIKELRGIVAIEPLGDRHGFDEPVERRHERRRARGLA